MTFKYLTPGGEEAPFKAIAASPAELPDLTSDLYDVNPAWSLTNASGQEVERDPVAAYNDDVGGRLAKHNAHIARGVELTDLLEQLFREERFAVFNPRNARVVIGSLHEYERLLTKPGEAEQQIRSKSWVSPESAAASLAALILLDREPLAGPVGRVAQWLGHIPRALYQNLGAVRDHVVANRLLLCFPEGVPALPDYLLASRRDNQRLGETAPAFSSAELRLHQLGYTGLGGMPATIALLAAEAIDERSESAKHLRNANTAVRQAERAQKHTGRQLSYLADAPSSKDVQNAQSLLARQEGRELIESAVRDAARRWFDYDTRDKRKLSIMAELLVAQAHNFEIAPGWLKYAIGKRVALAARKSGVHSAGNLPPKAGALYDTCRPYFYRPISPKAG